MRLNIEGRSKEIYTVSSPEALINSVRSLTMAPILSAVFQRLPEQGNHGPGRRTRFIEGTNEDLWGVAWFNRQDRSGSLSTCRLDVRLAGGMVVRFMARRYWMDSPDGSRSDVRDINYFVSPGVLALQVDRAGVHLIALRSRLNEGIEPRLVTVSMSADPVQAEKTLLDVAHVLWVNPQNGKSELPYALFDPKAAEFKT